MTKQTKTTKTPKGERKISKAEQRRRLEESRFQIWRNRMNQMEKWAGKSW